ncbi:MAG TPA: hypothetical protein VIH64_13710, partial [Streptosporangiaceae bacterium]
MVGGRVNGNGDGPGDAPAGDVAVVDVAVVDVDDAEDLGDDVDFDPLSVDEAEIHESLSVVEVELEDDESDTPGESDTPDEADSPDGPVAVTKAPSPLVAAAANGAAAKAPAPA